MKTSVLAAFACSATLASAQTTDPRHVIELAHNRAGSAELRTALLAATPETDLKKGTAVVSYGPDFIFAVESATRPTLFIDGEEEGEWMQRSPGDSPAVWYQLRHLKTGTSHGFVYQIDGKAFGGKTDLPAYLPDSYERAGVPQGKLVGPITHTSRVYPDMRTQYWIYVPAEYDGHTPAGLMVWQDGHNFTKRDGSSRLPIVVDNLTYEKKIPVAIEVLIDPGMVGDKRMRSIEYDTLNDTYVRFVRDEILADVGKEYKLRADSYSRAIGGESSGGICAFNAAWFHPEMFSRVLSRIGSFTSIQWHPGVIDGGNVYPFKIRKEPKRNIRVWLQDGANDLENRFGSWPLQNLQMANSLKMMGYDFHLSFGTGTHNTSQGNAELPVSLAWLWRDYDPSRTEQTYTMERSEESKPLYRVRIANR